MSKQQKGVALIEDQFSGPLSSTPSEQLRDRALDDTAGQTKFATDMLWNHGGDGSLWRSADDNDGSGRTEPLASSLGTITQIATYLNSGYWAWSGYAGTNPRHWSAGGTVSVNITDLNSGEQALAIAALNAWHEVANINFTFTSGAAQITYNNNGSGVAGTSETVSGTSLTSATIDISSDWWPNTNTYSYMYQSYLHETGHALGLGHSGPYNGSATYGVDNVFTNDTWQYSVMSYFNQSNFGGATYDYVITPQMVDIAAVQSTYGAATTRTGNTTYGFNSNAGSIYDLSQYSGTPAFTIYDSGGTDTFDVSGYSVAQTINLNGGAWSSIGGYVNNIGVYTTTVVENAVGGAGNDTVTANGADNTIRGRAGNDAIDGGGGTDTAIFAGLRSAYTLTDLGGGGVRVVGPDGTDTLSSIERLQFDDQTVTWPPTSSLPDLDALNMSLGTTSLTTGGSTTVSYTVSNLGTATAAASTAGVYRSADSVFDASDVLLTTRSTASLAAGSSISDSFSLTLTNAGTYNIIVVADYAGAITESNETNNPSNAVQVTVTGTAQPDLDAFNLALSNTSVSSGGTTTVSYTVSNLGSAASAASTVGIYRSTDGTFDASDTLLTTRSVGSLSAGGTFNDSFSLTLSTTGNYNIIAVADYNSAIAESNESNNPSNAVAVSVLGDDYAGNASTTGQVSVGSTITGNLEAVGDSDWFRIQLTSGVSYTIQLEGAPTNRGTLSDPFLRLYDGSSQLLASNDDFGGTLNSALTFTPTTSGTYYIGAGAYSDSFSGTYRVSVAATTQPDLTASNVSLSSTTLSPGQNVTVAFQINNIGTGVAGGFYGGLYLSADTNVTTADTLLGFQFFGSLSGNASASGSQLVTLPSGLTSGSAYYVGVIADDLNAVNEGNEANNASGPIQITVIGSDDYAADVTTAGRIAAGGSITGNLEVAGDRDWFRIDMNAGRSYSINLEGAASGAGSLTDPYLRIYSGAGAVLATDDDSGAGLNSQVAFTPSASGSYYIEAAAFADFLAGTYRLTVDAGPTPNDFNGDAHGDFLWQNTSGQPGIWLMNGTTPTSTVTVGPNPGPSWTVAGSGDFDGNGKSDILWQNTNGQPGVWLMDGTTPTSTVTVGPNPGPSWKVAGSGDFDGNGKSDILWQNTNGQSGIWLMDGTTPTSMATVGPNPGPAWKVIGSGDFDGDGKSDILWQNDNGQAGVWLMNGTTPTSTVTVGPNPGPAWKAVGTGDFNGDGKSDILWQNTNGQPGIWLMNGTTPTSLATVGPNPGTSWTVTGSADVDGNGKSDILWQNTNGQPGVWLMDGVTPTSTVTVGPNPGPAWQVVHQHHDLF